jgi:hypothetical protein
VVEWPFSSIGEQKKKNRFAVQVVGYNEFGAGVREASFSVLRRACVQSRLQHIRDEKNEPDRIVQHANPEYRSSQVSKSERYIIPW